MKRKLIVIALIAAMLVGILHTGKINNDLEEESKRQSYYQTENVYVWYSDEAYTDFFTNAAVAFHEKNPDIRVIPMYADSNEYLEKINETSVKGEGYPDVFVTSNNSLEKVYLAGLASAVRDRSVMFSSSSHFSPSALSAVEYNGNYIAYPLSFETTVLLYNENYLLDWIEKVNAGEVSSGEGVSRDEMGDEFEDEGETEEVSETESIVYTLENTIPKTFDDIKELSHQYEAPAGVDGVLDWDVSDIFFNYLFAGYYMNVGGDAGDDSDNIDISNEQAIESVKYYQNLNQFFSIDTLESSYTKVLDDFLAGKSVFTIVTSDALAKVNAKIESVQADIDEKTAEKEALINEISAAKYSGMPYEDLEKKLEAIEIPTMVKYGFAPVPDLTDEIKSRSLSVTDCLVINGYSEVKEAANKFAAFATTEYSSQIYSRTGKLAASTDAGYTDPAMITFQTEYAESIPLPKIVEVSNLWVQLEICFVDIWKGASVEERFKTFEKQIKLQMRN